MHHDRAYQHHNHLSREVAEIVLCVVLLVQLHFQCLPVKQTDQQRLVDDVLLQFAR